MDDDTESERLRTEQRRQEIILSQLSSQGELGGVVVVGKTTKVGTYPTALGSFFWIQAHAVFGTEVEGGAGNLVSLGGTFLAAHRGPSLPPEGAEVICFNVNFRFVFEY